MRNMSLLVAVYLALSKILSTEAYSDAWSDRDGNSYVVINSQVLSLYNTEESYFFNELLSNARKGTKIRICLGIHKGTGMGSDCLGLFSSRIGMNNEGKNRSLHFDIRDYTYVFSIFEDSLRSGSEMKLSIDNNDLFYAVQLRDGYKLSKHAKEILRLPD